MDHNSTSAAGQAPAHIMRRRHSQAQHGLVSTSRSPPKHAPLNTSGPMETDNGELRSPTSPSIDPQHGVSIIMAPDNLPREIPVSPSRYTNDELEKMLNGASTTKTHVPRSAAGRTLLVVSGAGDALPSLFGPLLDSLSQALSIESPDPVFTSVDEISTEQLDLDRTSSSVLACTGYSAGDVLESLGSGKGIAKGRTFVAGLILIDAFIDPNHLERLNWSNISQSCGFILQFYTSRQPSDLQISLRDAVGSQLFGAPGESDAEAASVIASTVLEYVDGRNPVSVGPMNERERMDVMDDMIE